VTPAITSPSRAKAMFTAQIGRPIRKLAVPSSGSQIQVCEASAPSVTPPSSPRKP
jgi:hypothetical protein